MAVKEYFLPKSIEEAVGLLQKHGSALMITGGGTHTMMLINNGYAMPEAVMGLRHAGINTIAVNGTTTLGAMATMSQILASPVDDLLLVAAQNVGSWAVRNMATIGGNLMMPAPAGDFAVALLALDATVKLVSAGGSRTVSLSEFYAQGRTLAGELVAEVQVPPVSGQTAYLKYARRDANAPTIVTVAARVVMNNGQVTQARIALNGAALIPSRASTAEQSLVGQVLNDDTIEKAATLAAESSTPFTDAVASEWYRRKMVKVYVKRALENLN